MKTLHIPIKHGVQLINDKDNFFIKDGISGRKLSLTPEEWVRQHWVSYFLQSGWHRSAIITEKKILLGNISKRIDLLLTHRTQPLILLECKAPEVRLSEQTFEQCARYNAQIHAPNILLSNGIEHIFATYNDRTYRFLPFHWELLIPLK